MNVDQIQNCLKSSNPQERMRGITALRLFEPEVAVPLLMARLDDPEFIIRSQAAMGLGYKQSSAAFNALMQVLEQEPDPNVRAEAANSLSLYGDAALPHLVQMFWRDRDWLIRLSILAALGEMNCADELFEVCYYGLADDDLIVRETAIAHLAFLVDTDYEQAALKQLLALTEVEDWQLRRMVALALGQFPDQQAQTALAQLRQDEDYRVVAATLETLLDK